MVLCGLANLQARPEFFVEAIQFGANDCTFCHHSVAGGKAVNERGEWLLSERIRRDVVDIDVNWLADRGEQADDSRTLEVGSSSLAKTGVAEPQAKEAAPTSRLPMDYTTQWGEWPSYGGGLKSQKYSPLPYINKETIHNLELVWIWEALIDNARSPSGDSSRRRFGAGQPFKGTPLMVAGKVYLRTRFSTVVAIDAETGVQLWEYDPGTRLKRRPPMFGFATRGLAYHKQANCDAETPCERIVLLTSDGYLTALDLDTGKPIESFGTAGKVDLTQGLRRPLDRTQASWSHPALVCNDVVVVGSQLDDASQFQFRGKDWKRNLPLGDVRGFDPLTGKQLWVFKTIPQEGEVGVETWGNESWKWMGNANVWSTFSCDPDLGYVYLPVTAATSHMYGGERPGDNLFSTSVVALDINTGARIWHFQITRHDIWDYDLPTQPVVADIVIEGQVRKIVAQVTKVGYLFVLDRITGEPIWPIEDRPAPPSTLRGEVAAATQPHPTKPPPFELQGFSLADINDLTPELRRRSLEIVEDLDHGPLYTPISERGIVLNPGIGGGANWPGASFDPIDRLLFVSSRRDPIIAKAIPINEERWGFPYRDNWSFTRIDYLPYIKPPWSSITAYAMDRGEILWQVPNGEGPKDHALLESVRSTLPDLGQIGANPSILVLPDIIVMGHYGETSHLKALDKATGEEIWSIPIVGYYSDSAPVTYMLRNKQYLLISSGHVMEPARLSAYRIAVGDQETAD